MLLGEYAIEQWFVNPCLQSNVYALHGETDSKFLIRMLFADTYW